MRTILITIIFLLSMNLSFAQAIDSAFRIKIIAIIWFLNGECPGIGVNVTLSERLLQSNGITPEKISSDPETKRQLQEYSMALRNTKPESCEYMWRQYGADGTVLQGLAVRK